MRLRQVGIGRSAAVLLVIVAFLAIAMVFRPEPVSDFLYYWMIAQAPDLYHKGGVVGWLFAPMRAAGIAPYAAAALLNICCAVLAVFAILPSGRWPGNRMTSLSGAGVVILAILAATPAAALVATDLMALSAFVIGMRLLTCQGPSSRRWLTATGALLSLALSASLRPIYAPVMIVSGVALMLIQHGMCASEETSRLKGHRFSAGLAGVLIVLGGLLVANLLERSLLNHSRTSQYAPGVVRAVVAIGHDMGDGKETCGRWSESRARFGLDRRAEPLVPFILDRQREVGWKNLPGLYACKISRLLGFRDWFASWLEGSQRYRQDRILADSMGVDVSEVDAAAQQSHVARTDEMRLAYEARARMLVNASHWIGGMLQIMIVLFLAASTMALARARSLRFDLCVLGVSLVPAMALIVLHGVFFEVQARYAFPVWVLPPVFMTLIGKATDSGFLAATAGRPPVPDVV